MCLRRCTLFVLLLTISISFSTQSKGDRESVDERKLRVGKASKVQVREFQLIGTLSLQGGGQEFDDPESYQSRALDYVMNERGLNTLNEEVLTYYGLACVFLASSGVHNKRTLVEFSNVPQLPPWLRRDGWLSSNQDKCSWSGVVCDGSGHVIELNLAANRLFGVIAPEIQHLAFSLRSLNFFNNFYLVTDGDEGNAWIGELSNLRALNFGTTSFEYLGIPIFFEKLANLGM